MTAAHTVQGTDGWVLLRALEASGTALCTESPGESRPSAGDGLPTGEPGAWRLAPTPSAPQTCVVGFG